MTNCSFAEESNFNCDAAWLFVICVLITHCNYCFGAQLPAYTLLLGCSTADCCLFAALPLRLPSLSPSNRFWIPSGSVFAAFGAAEVFKTHVFHCFDFYNCIWSCHTFRNLPYSHSSVATNHLCTNGNSKHHPVNTFFPRTIKNIKKWEISLMNRFRGKK